ncbi:hypothetical protein [Streptomyces antnestii]|uniref:hypothetical protein n=1 Tax=Streptomyces antnestii TaxID=2494256 RepID=UPI001CB96F0E|nr:hypothetical protein [Streptomyces sp. San01]
MTQRDWQNDVLRDLLRQTQAQLGGEGAEAMAQGAVPQGAVAPAAAVDSTVPAPDPDRAPLPRRRTGTAPSPDAGPGPSPSPPLDADDDPAPAPEPLPAAPAPRRTPSLAERMAESRAARTPAPTTTEAETETETSVSGDAVAEASDADEPTLLTKTPTVRISPPSVQTPAVKPEAGVPEAVPAPEPTVTPAPPSPPYAPPVDAPPPPHQPPAPPLTGLPAPYVPAAPGPAPAGLPAPYTPALPQPQAPLPVPARMRNAPLPAFTPESVPTVDPRLAGSVGRAQHGDTVARRTGRSLRRLTASLDGSDEARLAREIQQPVTNGRVVAVTSIRGGVGKTTVSALLSRTLNHYRHDPVLALEADAALGTLPVRLGAESVRWSCPDLAQILTPKMQITDVTGYLVPVTGGGWLLPASQGRVGAPLDIRTYRTVSLALRRYFAMTVVDCETLPGEVARTAMDTAHARVVVAPMTVEGVGGTRVVLDWLARLPKAALASTVVALTSSAPHMTLDLKAATAHLREAGVAVVHLPYDRHLAAGGPIQAELLSDATRRAAARLAAEAVQRAARQP